MYPNIPHLLQQAADHERVQGEHHPICLDYRHDKGTPSEVTAVLTRLRSKYKSCSMGRDASAPPIKEQNRRTVSL